MCRLLVVKAEQPIQLAQLLTKPAHSIINQASDSRLRLDAGSINADGFGVGWYPTDCDDGAAADSSGPCVFRSITPAWSNANLHRLADKIKSPLVFAHVRASTTGALSEENTHPWTYGNLIWMHNGCISDFARIKRRLQADLSDEYFAVPQGNTDSEWAFACFLEQLSRLTDPLKPTIPHATLRQAMLDTVQLLTRYTDEIGASDPSLLKSVLFSSSFSSYIACLSPRSHGSRTRLSRPTSSPRTNSFCVSDGSSVVATRYITSATEEAASLFFSTGSTFEEYAPGSFKMNKADKRERIILIASEPLTFERADWVEIPSQSCIVITPRNNLLRFPIINDYFRPDVAAHRRDEFARAKGYRWSTTPVSIRPPVGHAPTASVATQVS